MRKQGWVVNRSELRNWNPVLEEQIVLNSSIILAQVLRNNSKPVYLTHTRLLLIGTPGDLRKLSVSSGIRINWSHLMHLYRLWELNLVLFNRYFALSGSY